MWRSCRIRFRSGVMPKAPFVFDHTPKDSPLEGVTITAGARAAVSQPSTPASGRGDAREGGDSCAIPPPFQRREVGVRTSHTSAAERLSSMPHIVPYPELPLAIPCGDRQWRDHWCIGLSSPTISKPVAASPAGRAIPEGGRKATEPSPARRYILLLSGVAPGSLFTTPFRACRRISG